MRKAETVILVVEYKEAIHLNPPICNQKNWMEMQEVIPLGAGVLAHEPSYHWIDE